MIHFTDSTSSMPADEARPNWKWLQMRIEQLHARSNLESWIVEQLVVLENSFADSMTAKSLERDERSQLLHSRDGSGDKAL